MKVLAFGASSSLKSINKEFARYTANNLFGNNFELVDLDFANKLPVYSIDIESSQGVPNLVIDFAEKVKNSDVLIISYAEHNGSYTSAYKNLFDWLSRYKNSIFKNKKTILISTSPGERGGKSVLDAAVDRMPRHGCFVIASFSLESFNENYSFNQGIINKKIQIKYNDFINSTKVELDL